MKKKKRKKEKGFTLIELLVVISIIGVLSSIVVASLGDLRNRARETKFIAEVMKTRDALELFYLENNRYPDHNYANTFGELELLRADLKLPSLPSGSNFYYLYDSDSASPNLSTCRPRRGSYIIMFYTKEKIVERYFDRDVGYGLRHCMQGV